MLFNEMQLQPLRSHLDESPAPASCMKTFDFPATYVYTCMRTQHLFSEVQDCLIARHLRHWQRPHRLLHARARPHCLRAPPSRQWSANFDIFWLSWLCQGGIHPQCGAAAAGCMCVGSAAQTYVHRV